MNGASAELCANTSRTPNNISTRIIGSNQNFFRSLSSIHISRNIESIFILHYHELMVGGGDEVPTHRLDTAE
jgi:hypothetical protein